MKSTKWKAMFISFVVLSFLFVTGCDFGKTSDVVSTAITTEQVETTTQDVITTINTTTETQTTTEIYTTTETQATTTETPINYDLEVDELVLSLDRLNNTDFSINTKFVDEPVNQAHMRKSTGFYRDNIRISTTSLLDYQIEDIINPNDYVQDEENPYMFYNKALIETPILENGMYRVTESLDGKTLFNLYEFVTDLTFIANMSKDQVDWAVRRIRVMNTWVIRPAYFTDMYSDCMYLLNYDSDNDIVNLYFYYIYTLENGVRLGSYNKISAYYNKYGEEVIETYQIYDYLDGPSEVGIQRSISYFSSIGGRDYNLYLLNLDEFGELMNNYCLRGVNLDSDGSYKFYENYDDMDRLYIKGTNGWYNISPNIDYETGVISDKSNFRHYMFSPDLGNEVIYIAKYDNYFSAYVYLSAFNGDIALLYEEDCLSQGKIYNITDYYRYYANSINIGGVETDNGIFYTSDEKWNGVVEFNSLSSLAHKESRILYNQYFNYNSYMLLNIHTETKEEAIINLENYLDHIGLSYRFGSNSDIISEYKDFSNDIERHLSDFPITNDCMNFDEKTYSNTDKYDETLDFLIEYTDFVNYFETLKTEYDSVNIDEQPYDDYYANAALANMDNILSGTANLDIDNLTIDISSLDIVFNSSPLLQMNEQYSVFYAYIIGGKLYPFYKSQNVTFSGTNMTFNTDEGIPLGLPNDLPEGDFTLVAFIGKVSGNRYIRVTTISTLITQEFDFKEVRKDIGNGYDGIFSIYYQNGLLKLSKEDIDIQPPSFTLIEDQTINIGSDDINWTDLIMDLVDNSGNYITVLEVEDNVDYDTLGTYTVIVLAKDETGNSYTQTFNVTVTESS